MLHAAERQRHYAMPAMAAAEARHATPLPLAAAAIDTPPT